MIQETSLHISHPTGPNQARSTGSASDDIAKVFNTALISTSVESNPEFSAELCELMQSPAFASILGAVRQYARLHGVSERQAAEKIIQTFRKMDQLWSGYVLQEGVDRLRSRMLQP